MSDALVLLVLFFLAFVLIVVARFVLAFFIDWWRIYH